MNAHPGCHSKQPASIATGDLSQRNLDGMTVENPARHVHRIPGKVEILRHHIAGTERNDAQGHGGSGESLDYVEDGAVTATDKNGVVALRNSGPGLSSGGSIFASLQDVNRSTRLAESTEDAVNIPAPCARALQYRIY